MRAIHDAMIVILAVSATLVANAVSASDSFEQQQRYNPVTSEERIPAICPSGTLAGGVSCTGRYCDNVGLRCGKSPWNATGGYFTRFFSDEFPAMEPCERDYAIAGLACKGRYCDDIALWCVHIEPPYRRSTTDCRTTGTVSEENGGKLSFGSGRVAVAARCSGDYCDNMKFLTCRVSRE